MEGKIWGLRAGGLRKDQVLFYSRNAKKDSIIYCSTTAREAVSARPQVGYVVIYFVSPFLKNGRLEQLDCSIK